MSECTLHNNGSTKKKKECKKLGLYIHWPFCISKCPYCDFNSHVAKQFQDEEKWFKAFSIELERYHSFTADHELLTIFFGGGTPSLMSVGLVEKLIQKALSLWQHGPDIEITLEANPSSVEAKKFCDLEKVGVNRISLGIQSFNDQSLKFLGRKHDSHEARQALEIAFKYFKRVSFDLIYALPDQTVESWERELEDALTYNSNHLSLYQLIIEPGTQFMTRYSRGDFKIPDQDLSTELYDATEELVGKNGLYAYEVSNYARPGSECQHNLIYWNYENYVGIGPGAHGRINHEDRKIATEQIKTPALWMESALKGNADKSFETIAIKEQMIEKILMGIRLENGFLIPNLLEVIDESRVDKLIDEQLIVYHDDILRCTNIGMRKINAILSFLFN